MLNKNIPVANLRDGINALREEFYDALSGIDSNNYQYMLLCQGVQDALCQVDSWIADLEVNPDFDCSEQRIESINLDIKEIYGKY